MSAATGSRSRRWSARTATRMSISRRRPTPKTLADAKVVFANGLGFEGWIDAAGQGVRHQGADDRRHQGRQAAQGGGRPRPWRRRSACLAVGRRTPRSMSPTSATRSIAADPAGKDAYEANAAAYLGKLDALEPEVKAAIEKIPADRRRIITTHDAFGYFAARLRRRRSSRRRASRPKPRHRPRTSPDHHPDQEAEDPGGVHGERHRPAPAQADRRGDRRAASAARSIPMR